MPAGPNGRGASSVLMVRPCSFGFNRETASSNRFQQDDPAVDAAAIQDAAITEFEGLAVALRVAGVQVIAIDDTLEPRKPDAVFPNNWISFHAEGDVILYPMLAPSRRVEARLDVLDILARQYGLHWPRLHDMRDPAVLGGVLEGTGSLVLDRRERVAYAAVSPRTEPAAVAAFCRRFDYAPVLFRAVDAAGQPVYHTNVMMALGDAFAVVCLESIASDAERATVGARLEASGRTVLPISLRQMGRFAANLLALRGHDGQSLLVGSDAAADALGRELRARVEAHARLVTAPLHTIERFGGGSARCMLAEVDPPAR